MNKLFLPVLFSTVLCAQNPAPPPADIAPDTVIATVDGRKLTYGELNSYVSTLAPAQAKTAMENLETTVRQYALLNKLSKMGEDDKLDQKQPYVDILRAGRMQVLAQATISEQYKAMLVLPNEQEGYYKDHLNQYSKLKVKTIYIGFAANPSAGVAGKKYRSEEEARTLAGDLVKKLRAGADFVAMVKEYSDDEASKKNDGDWGTPARARWSRARPGTGRSPRSAASWEPATARRAPARAAARP